MARPAAANEKIRNSDANRVDDLEGRLGINAFHLPANREPGSWLCMICQSNPGMRL
jgi:hypothetical protein